MSRSGFKIIMSNIYSNIFKLSILSYCTVFYFLYYSTCIFKQSYFSFISVLFFMMLKIIFTIIKIIKCKFHSNKMQRCNYITYFKSFKFCKNISSILCTYIVMFSVFIQHIQKLS